MKKLLSILGTITIAGSGMAGLVGNASPPEKNEINYWQTNNLENLPKLKRNKRETISSNKKIWFGGYADAYKGEIKINSYKKKINFTGNNEQFHRY